MSTTRREFLIKATEYVLLTGAAAVAWDYVKEGRAEAAPNYKASDHWWAMIIDIEKCIGCGNCVRACSAENGVPEGYFRTWVERYYIPDWQAENPVVDSP